MRRSGRWQSQVPPRVLGGPYVKERGPQPLDALGHVGHCVEGRFAVQVLRETLVKVALEGLAATYEGLVAVLWRLRFNVGKAVCQSWMARVETGGGIQNTRG